MKNVVFTDTAEEGEFKPDRIFEQYLSLNAADLKSEFKNKKSLKNVVCPACRSDDANKAFKKFGFEYLQCDTCGTVYMSPRPDDREIRNHFLASRSSHYWQETLTKTTDKKRREKIYFPRFQWILDTADEYLSGKKIVADINSKNISYSRELAKNKNFSGKIIVNPYFDPAALEEYTGPENNTRIVPKEDMQKKPGQKPNVLTAFEVIDYTSDVDALMTRMREMLSDDGLCFITTISISGFDLQVLWNHSESVFPVDRINVFSQKGLLIFFKRHGFELIEFSTPGMLDLNIVEEAYRRDPSLEIPRFIKMMIDRDDDQLKKDFQTFLQVNKLSSFVRIVTKKKGV
jgi:Zn ribbon nucleic-acid-binding protein